MIYVFYNNDPQADDQGGGAEHYRSIYRLLQHKQAKFKLIAAKMASNHCDNRYIEYISDTAHFGKYYLELWRWFKKNRRHFGREDIFHFHRNYAIWPKYFFAASYGKTIVSYHNTTGRVLAAKIKYGAKFIRNLMIIAEKRALNYADKIIYVSERDQKNMSNIIGKNLPKVTIIPAAFDAAKFGNSCIVPQNLSNKILVIGRLSYQKNVEMAIEVYNALCRKYPQSKFVLTVAGDGESKHRVLAKIKHSPYQRQIDFLGRVPHNQVPQLIVRHGIVLVTSRYEASPTIIKEAIASRRPVVTTDVGDVPLWIKQGQNGFICKLQVDELANYVWESSKLIENQTYDQAIDTEQFSEKNIMERLWNVYQQLSVSV